MGVLFWVLVNAAVICGFHFQGQVEQLKACGKTYLYTGTSWMTGGRQPAFGEVLPNPCWWCNEGG